MFSIIICSAKPILLDACSSNIKKTVGINYEIIAIDNSKNIYGISEAYNIGAEKAKFDKLCFVHEDVLFKSSDWGQTVCSILKNKEVGLVGVAGSTVKAKSPSPWWLKNKEYIRANIYHLNGKHKTHLFNNPDDEKQSDVVVIDGVFMCCRKEVWAENKFDTSNFPKFHSYDIDFSMQILQKHRICVTYNIDIEHNSSGSYNWQWIDSVIVFSEKWKNQLPISINQLSKKESVRTENEALTIFTTILLSSSQSNALLLKFLFKKIGSKLFDKINILLIKRFIRKLIRKK